MGLIKEFKEFAMRGNVMDMAVGIIIGGAFGKIVGSLVNDVIMPPIGKLMGGVDFGALKYVIQDGTAAVTNAAGEVTPAVEEVAIRYGQFINVTIDFLIVAFAIFIVIKMMNKASEAMKKQEEEKPATPPEPTKEEALLGEIRDILKSKS